jgi:GYF domain 2
LDRSEGDFQKPSLKRGKTKVTEELSAPPPLPNLGDASNQTNEWYYVANGARQDPTKAATIKDLLNKKEIETDTQVWRKGMPEWKPLRESDLADLVAAEPPAISSHHIGNGYVWTLALLPLVFGVIEAAVSASNQEAAARSLVLGFPYHPSRGLPVQVPVVINALLGWLDDRRLKQAGYGSRLTRVTAVLFTPVYLFLRAKRLKQRPYYAVAWILSMIVGFLIYAGVES